MGKSGLAQRTNRPILSLRLLGNLTDDFSCANSRFFRVTNIYYIRKFTIGSPTMQARDR